MLVTWLRSLQCCQQKSLRFIRNFSTIKPTSCASCGNYNSGDCGLSLIRCTSCGSLLPLCTNQPDFYSLFCVPPTFQINNSALRNQYLRLQRLLHPDNFSGSNESLKATADRWSAYVNRAYEILKDDHKRAIYMYQHESGKQLEDELESKGTSEPGMDSLLAEVMEVRMELEDCQDLTIAKMIAQDNVQKIQDTFGKLKTALSRKEWEEARKLLIRLRYWKSIDSVAQQIIDELSS